jgi:hypothetical protein
MGSWTGLVRVKFVRALTFQQRFRGISKKDQDGLSGLGDKPFSDRFSGR